MDVKITKQDILNQIEFAKVEIAKMPLWKQQCLKETLENSSTRKTPREPVIYDTDDCY